MPSPSAAGPKRSRGAQPGNHNAIKHGFYSRIFREIEIADLERLSEDLESEIASLRVWARRLQENANGETLDIETGIHLLNGLGLAFSKIAHMLQINAIIAGSHSGYDAVLNKALEEVIKELTCPIEK